MTDKIVLIHLEGICVANDNSAAGPVWNWFFRVYAHAVRVKVRAR